MSKLTKLQIEALIFFARLTAAIKKRNGRNGRDWSRCVAVTEVVGILING